MIDLVRFWAGDPAYLGELIEAQSKWLFPVVLESVGDEDRAKDRLQDIWIRVIENRTSYRGLGKFEAWLHRIALNECRLGARRTATRDAALRETAETGLFDDLSWKPLDPLDEVLLSEMRVEAQAILEDLSPREREAVNLRILQGNTTRGVAQIMGIEESTVRSLVRRGLDRLRIRKKGS